MIDKERQSVYIQFTFPHGRRKWNQTYELYTEEKMKRIGCAVFALLMMLPLTPPVGAQPTEEVFDLGQVLVLDKGETQDKITTTETVSLDDIKQQGAQTVADALEHVVGVDVRSGNKGAFSLSLRGFDQRDVKVLIDGIPAHVAYNNSLDLGQLPIDTIAKIEVTKGASSVLYGSNTLGGVVNIITKKGSATPHTSITTSFGPNQTQNYIANHGGAMGKLNYWVSASHRTSDGFELSDDFDPKGKNGTSSEYREDGGTRQLSHYTFNTLNTKIGYEADNNSKVYLSFDYHDNEKGCPVQKYRYWEHTEWKQWHLNLVGEHDLTDKLTLKARTFYVKHDNTIEDVSWDATHKTPDSTTNKKKNKRWFKESAYDDYTIGGTLQAYYDLGDVSHFKLGASYIKDNHRQQDVFDATTYNVVFKGASVGTQPKEEYETDIYSFGIEDEIHFLKRWTAKFGTSFDIHDPVKAYKNGGRSTTHAWNPQAGLAFDLDDSLNIYTSVSKKTRFPEMQELYSDLSGGNSSLKPQKTIAYEIGAKKRFNDRVKCSAAIFHNDISDRILQVEDAVSGDDVYTNTSETHLTGLETQVNINMPWGVELDLGYTYVRGEEKSYDKVPTLDVALLPGHKATFDARYHNDHGLGLSFQAVYTGEQVDNVYDKKKKTYNEETIDDFFVCNFKVNQVIQLSDRLSTDLFVQVKNIFDEDYEEGKGPQPGRSFLVGATLSF